MFPKIKASFAKNNSLSNFILNKKLSFSLINKVINLILLFRKLSTNIRHINFLVTKKSKVMKFKKKKIYCLKNTMLFLN
jgi:hypothetical protein